MDEILRISVLAVTAAVCCFIIRGKAGEMAIVLSLAAVVSVILVVASCLRPIIHVFEQMQKLADISGESTRAMMKVVGIGFLTQMTAAVCVDAGEQSLSKAVEFAGGVLSFYAGLPIVSAILSLLEEILH